MNLTFGLNEQLDKILRDMASKLGVTIEELYKQIIAYYQVKGMVDVGFGLSLLIVVVVVGIIVYKTIRRTNDDFLKFVCFLFSVFGFPFSIGIALYNIYNGLLMVYAPQGYLIIKILEMLANKK